MTRIWILVYTVGCILEQPEIFYSKSEAQSRLQCLLKSGGLKDYDEIEIFEKRVYRKN